LLPHNATQRGGTGTIGAAATPTIKTLGPRDRRFTYFARSAKVKRSHMAGPNNAVEERRKGFA
jgi:hypothetical protein